MRFQAQGPAGSAVDDSKKAIELRFLVGPVMPFTFTKVQSIESVSGTI